MVREMSQKLMRLKLKLQLCPRGFEPTLLCSARVADTTWGFFDDLLHL